MSKMQYEGKCRRRSQIVPLPNSMRVVLSLLLFFSFGIVSFAQEPTAKPLVAPGGLIVIPPHIDYESVVFRADLTELLAVLPMPSPDLQGELRFHPDVLSLSTGQEISGWARDIRVARDVWCLKFSFKPVRLIDVDIPNAEGNFDKKKIWYLVYNVKHLGPAEIDGGSLKVNSSLGSEVPAGNEKVLPAPENDSFEIRQQSGIFVPRPGSDAPVRFVPHFVLATHRLVLGTVPVENPETGAVEWQPKITAVAYDDRIVPLALSAIKRREGFDKLPETTVSIAQKDIAPGQDLWGVAMWTDVDPRINEFSIFLSGLTNAYRWEDKSKEIDEETGRVSTYENSGQIGEGRVITRRVLKTDWWRVGDANSLNESQIHFGSKAGTMPVSPFDRTDRLSVEERRNLETHTQGADINEDGWVSPAEKALYHLKQQDWLKPTFGYEWIFL